MLHKIKRLLLKVCNLVNFFSKRKTLFLVLQSDSFVKCCNYSFNYINAYNTQLTLDYPQTSTYMVLCDFMSPDDVMQMTDKMLYHCSLYFELNILLYLKIRFMVECF